MMKKFPVVFILSSMLLTGCGKEEALMKPYDVTSQQSEFTYFESADLNIGASFASDLCVVSGNLEEAVPGITAESASIYRLDDNEVLYAKNVHNQMNPASLTKIMTALLALESGRLEETVTVTEEAMITESGATLCDIKPGDQLTLRQLLNCCLVRSANDAASAIAVFLGGSLEGFSDMMNQRAVELGATNTNFLNPHGLTQENHYTTAYDLYLMLNEAMKQEEFLTIINQPSYTLTYTDVNGTAQSREFDNTNRYISGRADSPEGVKVIGGKTGTTNAAGSCLALLSQNSSGVWYCSVILKADGTELLFEEMSDLLALEN